MQSPDRPLITVIGPTGSGKSELGVILARKFGGEIVNFDSIQVYRRLDVGSAKPTPSERKGIPHHLMDILDMDEELTAGAFASRARLVLDDISGRGCVPILVGGTGFYLRALLDGLSPAPPREQRLRADLERKAPGVLHRFLRLRDPASAARIHPNDRQKLIRAVEITLLAARPASETQAEPRLPLRGFMPIKIGLAPDRSELCDRLNGRTVRMFSSGLLEETGSLLRDGVSAEAKPLQSLGYKQALAYLKGAATLEAAIEECQIKTRQYAKRQMTWFRSEKDVFWLNGFGSDEILQEKATSHVAQRLNSRASPSPRFGAGL